MEIALINKTIDLVAFSPHPDDAEMGCGGLLLKMKDKGYLTGIVDLTEGELSTNGNIETRKKETLKASKILKLDLRLNLELGDCNITNDSESRLKVINVIRRFRPQIVLIPFYRDRHPDHENSHKLLKDSIFISGLEKFKTSYPCYRPRIVILYMLNYIFEPSFIVDISNYYKQKMSACRAYKSQFYRPDSSKNKNNLKYFSDYTSNYTYINSKFFRDFITNRDKFWGLRIKKEYREPYFIESDLMVDDPIKFFNFL